MSELDIELMKEHLMIHDGLITKLLTFIEEDSTEDFKKIVQKHIDMLTSHEKIMEHLIEDEKPPAFTPVHAFKLKRPINAKEKYKVQDGLFTSKAMGTNNYQSSLTMQKPINKEAHLTMADQNYKLYNLYHNLLNYTKKD